MLEEENFKKKFHVEVLLLEAQHQDPSVKLLYYGSNHHWLVGLEGQ
jgi:hypothetical protein